MQRFNATRVYFVMFVYMCKYNILVVCLLIYMIGMIDLVPVCFFKY